MSDVKLYCPECGSKLSVKEATAGRRVACPDCSAQIPIPASSGSGSPPAGKLLSLDVRFLCPLCARKLAVDAVYAGVPLSCPKCDQEISVPQIHPRLLPKIAAADRADTAGTPAVAASVLSEDEVAFLLAPE